MPRTEEIEALARRMADEDHAERVAEIKASWLTDRPISPSLWMDYKMSADMWDESHDEGSEYIKSTWRDKAARILDEESAV